VATSQARDPNGRRAKEPNRFASWLRPITTPDERAGAATRQPEPVEQAATLGVECWPMAERDLGSRRRSLRDSAEIGRRLAAATGFRVVNARGAELGRLDHIRYQHRTDVPDEVVIRPSRFFPWRRQVIAFSRVETVEPRTRTILLRPAGESQQR
jgi:hypothetical protein